MVSSLVRKFSNSHYRVGDYILHSTSEISLINLTNSWMASFVILVHLRILLNSSAVRFWCPQYVVAQNMASFICWQPCILFSFQLPRLRVLTVFFLSLFLSKCYLCILCCPLIVNPGFIVHLESSRYISGEKTHHCCNPSFLIIVYTLHSFSFHMQAVCFQWRLRITRLFYCGNQAFLIFQAAPLVLPYQIP